MLFFAQLPFSHHSGVCRAFASPSLVRYIKLKVLLSLCAFKLFGVQGVSGLLTLVQQKKHMG